MQFLDALRKERPEIKVKLVDANANPGKFQAVAQQVGRTTVPQIFLDKQYVGGWDDLARAASRGQLDAYLDGGEWKAPEKKKRWWTRRGNAP